MNYESTTTNISDDDEFIEVVNCMGFLISMVYSNEVVDSASKTKCF